MAMAVAVDHEEDIAPAETSARTSPAAASAVRQRRAWWLRRMYSPVGAEQGAAPGADEGKPRRGGWLRRLVPPEHALRRRWKLRGGGAASRLLPGLPGWNWKRVSVGGGWAAATLDAAAFRVMYVVEAIVLGLALSCFFCCCGCQI